MNISEYKKILEQENKKGNKANLKRIEDAKNKLLSNENNLEETSQLLFNLENHTIEYSIKVLEDYLKDKDSIKEEDKKEEASIKFDRKRLVVEIIIVILLLLIVFFVTISLFSSK